MQNKTTDNEVFIKSIKGIGLLSEKEYMGARYYIDPIADCWWLRDAAGDAGGSIVRVVTPTAETGMELVSISGVAVRPALWLTGEAEEVLAPGNRFMFDGRVWTMLPGGMALCTESLCRMPFNRDMFAKTADRYDTSDVKRYLDLYLSRAKALNANDRKRFDVALIERPYDAGLTRREIGFLMDCMQEEKELIPFEVQGETGSAAMGFISRDAADKLMYRYDAGSGLYAYVTGILEDMALEHEDNVYRFEGLAVWLGRD